MLQVAHVVNISKFTNSADLARAQAITFKSMELAQQHIPANMQVSWFGLANPNDIPEVPTFFQVLHLEKFTDHALSSLPFLNDVLQTIYQRISADFIIFTNIDIHIQPSFYSFVYQQLNRQIDAFIINRRRIPDGTFSPHDLPQLFMQRGKSHPGFDCFIFPRHFIPNIPAFTIRTGVPFFEATMAYALFALAQNPVLFDREFQTFHIGMEIFKKRNHQHYWDNRRVFFKKVLPALWPKLHAPRLPYYHTGWLRVWYWAKNPALFTLKNLQLTWRYFRLGY